MQIDSFENWIGILVFEISCLEFGCNISCVRVLRSVNQKLTSESRLIYKGKEIPFYDMGNSVEIKSSSKIINKNIFIYEYHEGPFGFGIDKIKEVLPWNKKIFETEVKTENVLNNKFLLGKIYFQGRSILLPDFDKIISRTKSNRYAFSQLLDTP